MLIPSFSGCLFFGLVRLFIVFNVRLLALAVKIFAHQVQDSVDTFVRVVLPIAGKGRSIFSENTLEHLRSNCVLVHVPHLVYELRIGHNEATFSSKWVLLLEVVNKWESAFEEELRQFIRVAQALQTWIHVACVAQVLKTHNTIFAVRWAFLHAYFVELIVSLSTACRQMEILVFLATWLFAISYAFTLALDV